MRAIYQVTGIIGLIFAAFVFHEGSTLRYYTASGPGPGFFPYWLSIAFGLLSVLIFLSATVGPRIAFPPDFLPDSAGLRQLLSMAGAVCLAVLLLEPLGFRLTTFGLFVTILGLEKRQSWLAILLIALLGSFGTYYLFDTLLGTPLPIGVTGI